MLMDRFAPPRGTRDWAPDEARALRDLEDALLGRFAGHGYHAVRTPVFERFSLLAARAGDAIRESMFTFTSERIEYALRPEMTAPICRMLASGALGEGPTHRLCYAGPCFRYVRTGTRRLREFTQAGAELFGVPGPEGDCEVLGLALASLDALGLPDGLLRVGHSGVFGAALAELPADKRAVAVSLLDDQMSLAGRCEFYRASGGTEEDPSSWMREACAQVYRLARRTGDAAAPTPPAEYDDATVRALAESLPAASGAATARALVANADVAPELASRLVEAAAVHGSASEVREAGRDLLGEAVLPALDELSGLLERAAGGSRIRASLGVARGLEFYTGMVLEAIVPSLGGDSVIAGGGRYDNLVAELGGPSIPAVGFALGLEQALAARATVAGGESTR